MKISMNLVSTLFLIILFTGCTAKITSDNVTPTVHTEKKHTYSVQIKTDGGREKDPLGIPEISNEVLHSAVTNTIKKSQLFGDVVEINGDIIIEIYVVQIGQPVAGGTMTVNVEMAWAIKKDNLLISKKAIRTSSTKTMNDEGGAYNRIVEATRDAIQKNIRLGILYIAEEKI